MRFEFKSLHELFSFTLPKQTELGLHVFWDQQRAVHTLRVDFCSERRRSEYWPDTLRLAEDEHLIELPGDLDFDAVVAVNSAELDRDVRNADKLKPNNITLAADNDSFCLGLDGRTIRGATLVQTERQTDVRPVVNVYNFKLLKLLLKAHKLSDSVELRLKQNFPLVLFFHIEALGSLQLTLAPNEQAERPPLPELSRKRKQSEFTYTGHKNS